MFSIISKSFFSLVLLLLLIAFVSLSVNAEILAPLMIPKDANLIIPDKYIVVFKSPQVSDHFVSSQSTARINHATWLQALLSNASDSKLEHSFNLDGLSGYTGYFSNEIIDEIRKRDEIEYVEADQIMYAMNINFKLKDTKNIMKEFHGPLSKKLKKKSRNSSIINKVMNSKSTLLIQEDAPWGLKRISKALKEIFTDSSLSDPYRYPSSAGENVDVYIIDTGINVDHEDFEGRAKWGKTIPLFDLDIDGNGHGTHCAGTIGSKTFGVAKKANLIAVKVLRTSGFGTNSDVIKGVEWVTKQHRKNSRKGNKQSVANMSLGGGRSVTLEKVVDRAVGAGVHFSVAAGNDAEDACDYSPAAADGPITVGASTSADTMAYFSNTGKCVDIFAPGLDIKSTWIGSKDAVNTISGTSMASPHVAGVLALYLGEGNWTPKALKEELKGKALKEIIDSVPSGTPNLLVNTVHLISELNPNPKTKAEFQN